MTARLVSVCLLMFGVMIVSAAPPLRTQVSADPNDPEHTRTTITRAERDALGLKPHTWTGVVDPEVLARLDRLNRTVASLKDKMNKDKDVKALNTLWRIRFKGMVYVEVQLKDKDAQRRLLASLKASEFHPECLFVTNAGLTGYVSKDGLDKVSKHADVTGVCLDDKPLPTKGMTIFKENVPPPKPGEKTSELPGVTEQKVDPEVYRLFELHDRVDVAINLRSDSLPKHTDVRSEMMARNELRAQAETKIQEQVLSTVTADDLWVSGKVGPSLSGSITKEGLQKLWKHPDVKRIYIQDLSRIPNHTPVRPE